MRLGVYAFTEVEVFSGGRIKEVKKNVKSVCVGTDQEGGFGGTGNASPQPQ